MRSIIALILSWVKKIFALVTSKKEEPSTDIPDIDRPEPGPGEVVCYYGCPNSKKAQKLQLSKKLYR